MYKETVTELEEINTPLQHIKKLGVIMRKTEDDTLKKLIDNVIIELQRYLAHPKAKNKSIPGNLVNSQQQVIQDLFKYCSQFIKTTKPEWQVLAERNGWTPPTK